VWARANYSSKGTQVTNVESKDDGKGFFSNLWNILFGKATPHNCYGTSAGVKDCDQQWEKDTIPKSNAPTITKPDYKAPVVIPQYQPEDKLTRQVQKDSNAQMDQLLVSPPSFTAPAPSTPQTNEMLETLKNFKQEQ
jgi:hypothetical protein